MTRRLEEAMQASLVLWLRNEAQRTHPVLAWVFHCPNGGARNPVVAGQMVALGVKRGVPDLLLPIPVARWSGCAVECKTDDGRLTPEQVKWLQALHAARWQTHVVRTLAEGQAVFTAYANSQAHEATLWRPCAVVESIPKATRPRRRQAA